MFERNYYATHPDMPQFHAQLVHLEVTMGTALLPIITRVAEALAPSVASLRVVRGGWAGWSAEGGSGVVITPDGFILTSAHVVAGIRRASAAFVDLGVDTSERRPDGAHLDLAANQGPRRVHDEGADPGPDVQGDALCGTSVLVVVSHHVPL